MAESMDEFRGGALTASILEAPGIAWDFVSIVPPGVLMGSDTLLLSFGMRRAEDELRCELVQPSDQKQSNTG